MTYAVVWSDRQYDDFDFIPARIAVARGLNDESEAMMLAEVAALEHSERLNVKYHKCGNTAGKHTGFTFKTNSGTDVWYTVMEEGK